MHSNLEEVDSQDYSSILYRFSFEELMYIGLKDGSASKLLFSSRQLKSDDKTNFRLITDRVSLRGKTFTDVNRQCLGRSLSPDYSAKNMETLFILAELLHADLISPFTTLVVNQWMSWSDFKCSWFNDMRFIIKSLYNVDIDIEMTNCTHETSILFKENK